jgi:glycosyltransferase involved in cell wall biosynthesis
VSESDTAAPPRVSVCVVTYNQERFIAECLESILGQETDFPFEVIVADDGSTDGGRTIIKRFAREHPGRISPILHARNVGITANYLAAHQAARGEYVAHMDGDDVMLPGRLQIQADFLDANPKCAMVGSNAIAFSTDSDGAHRFEGMTSAKRHPPVFDFDYFVEHNGFLFPHSSKMYRRSMSPDMSGFERLYDVQLHVMQAAQGDVGYIHAPLLKYRINAGISVGRDGLSDHIASIELAEQLGAGAESVRYAYARACYGGALTSLRSGDHDEFRRRIELSARYGALQRSKDELWRGVLLRWRRSPKFLAALLDFKERSWRFVQRSGRPMRPPAARSA